jgi:hypothetical protein
MIDIIVEGNGAPGACGRIPEVSSEAANLRGMALTTQLSQLLPTIASHRTLSSHGNRLDWGVAAGKRLLTAHPRRCTLPAELVSERIHRLSSALVHHDDKRDRNLEAPGDARDGMRPSDELIADQSSQILPVDLESAVSDSQKEVAGDGLTEEMPCARSPGRLSVVKAPRLASCRKVLPIWCAREKLAVTAHACIRRSTRIAVPEGGVYVVMGTTAAINPANVIVIARTSSTVTQVSLVARSLRAEPI